jgi:glycine/D-amino acid oxidase-like deaminating enzyme
LGGDEWGYRRLTTYCGLATSRSPRGNPRTAHQIGWLSDAVQIERRLGSPDTTAQVHPCRFTAAMMRAAEAHGAELRIGCVRGLVRGAGAAGVCGVEVDGGIIEGDAVVIAMGPWSVLAAQWLPLPAVYGLKGHSLVFDTGKNVPAEALFLEYEEAEGALQSPEVFPRADGTTYVCAVSSDSPLPIDPARVTPDPGAIERLQKICGRLSPALREAKIVARQACHRPVTQDGLPLIGRVPGVAGAYVATGHSVWGILNAPATAEAVADLVVDGTAHAIDLAPFDPARLPPLDRRRMP